MNMQNAAITLNEHLQQIYKFYSSFEQKDGLSDNCEGIVNKYKTAIKCLQIHAHNPLKGDLECSFINIFSCLNELSDELLDIQKDKDHHLTRVLLRRTRATIPVDKYYRKMVKHINESGEKYNTIYFKRSIDGKISKVYPQDISNINFKINVILLEYHFPIKDQICFVRLHKLRNNLGIIHGKISNPKSSRDTNISLKDSINISKFVVKLIEKCLK